MSGTTYRILGVAGLILLALFLWWGSQQFGSTYQTISDDLAQYDELGTKVAEDFSAYPLVALNDEYTLTDTLKDGVEITYGGEENNGAVDLPQTGAAPGRLPSSASLLETDATAPTPDTTFASPDLQETLSLQFPQTLSEPLAVTLPGGRTFTITQNDASDYTSELLTSAPAEIPASDEGAADTLLLGDRSGPLGQVLVSSKEVSAAPEPTYLKYTSPDARLTTYYAYQKDQAAGYRNLKHWTIFAKGDGYESQSYTFHNAHLSTNDRGEVEVRYVAPPDESMKSQVDDNLWARAQAVISQDMEASIDERAPDLIIPAPYTIDAQGNHQTHEWNVMKAADYDPSNTTGDYLLSVSFEVPLLGYPIALDPTLQFTAPGVSNAGDYITGEATSNNFGTSLATGDFNADGKTDLAVGAYAYNSNRGRVYVFYSGNITPSSAINADAIITGEATNNYFGASLTTGDFNADGKDDLAVGAFGYTSFTGRTYVYYGGSIVSENASGADVILTGESTLHSFGYPLAVGDLNADGKDDLVVSALDYNGTKGRVYVFYNSSITTQNASAASIILSNTGSNNVFGNALSIGDYNADGKDDLAVALPGSTFIQGYTYVFYGGSMISENLTGADVTLTGEATNTTFGSSLTTGDFNADGKDDLVVGSAGYSSSQGRVYIFNGGSITTKNASAANVILTGEASGTYFGQVLTAGDLNNDGKDDLVVSTYYYTSNTGRVYSFYGGSLSSKNASAADVIFTGEATNNGFGTALTTGDLNNDGKDDLIVGASGYNSSQGRAYIFYSQSGQVNLNQHITGEGTADYFGSAFTTGDFNADGREDLAVGAYKDNTNTGKVYIFYNDGSYPTGAASADIILTGGATNDRFGSAFTTGDFNADGKDDIAVGANGYSSATGRAYIFYGGSMISEGAAGADITLTGETTNNNFGKSLAVGDFNTDGKDDLVVGASGYSSSLGRAYIFYGGSMISESASGSDITLTGGDVVMFGYSSATGDFNADGKDDLVIGGVRKTKDFTYPYTGEVYIFYGGSIVSETSLESDVILIGETSNNYFGSALTTGDFNADGKDDLVVGADGYNFSQGRVYLFYGGSMISKGAASADVILTGEAASSFGSALTTGDFNADGKDDLAVGTYQYTTSTGRTYIFYNDGSYPSSAANADIIITGDATNNDSGYALAAGDFNADGRTDLVVGAPGYNAGGDTGRISFYQTRENYAWEIQRQSLVDGLRVDPLMGYEMKITGETTSNSFGTSIALGDLNNDGKDDLIVGASGYNSNQGRVYIFYNDGNYPIKAGRADVTLTGENTGNLFGGSLTTGDFNADGKDDLVVGANAYSTNTGRSYIFYGGSIKSENASGADIILTGGGTNNYFGTALTVGDFNTDGKDDLAIGTRGLFNSSSYVYVFYGSNMISESSSGADAVLTSEANGNYFGQSLTTGDFNADGKDDIAAAAIGYNAGQGRIYIFYGGSIVTKNASSADIKLTGASIGDYFGSSLTTGDFNADGKDDIAIGASGYDIITVYGRVYVFYGGSMISEGASGADVIITGETTYNQFGISLTTGDFNADGRDDLAVGANAYSTNTGRTYIFYGGSIVTENASGADVILTGESTSNNYGFALAAGDLNADGTDDLIVGATGYNSSQGRLYFYTTNDRNITGGAGTDEFGSSFAVGDFNADGKNDLAVGAVGYNLSQGRVYIFYGGKKPVASVSGADIVLTGGVTGDSFGLSLTVGDFNVDGKDDLAVGADGYTTNTGRTYIFYGGSMITEGAAGADITLTGETTSNYFGTALTTGDFNADGKDDLVVGAIRYNSYQGRTYIFYGGSMISENASGADITLTGETTGHYFGEALSTGDLNNDGKDDLVIGAYRYNTSQGRAYIFYGGSMISENASGADITFTGETTTFNYFGTTLTTGDFNADGKDDLAIAANFINSQGKVYIFTGPVAAVSVTAANMIITGETLMGDSLAVGDFNADGKDDLAVGSMWYGVSAGRVYLFYGGRFHTTSAAHADVVITGEKANSFFGFALGSSDLSGNGVDDLVIGANGYDVSSDEGRVYVIMSEAATVKYSQHKLQGTLKFQGTGTFH